MVNMPSWRVTIEYCTLGRGQKMVNMPSWRVTIEYFRRGIEDGKHALMESNNRIL